MSGGEELRARFKSDKKRDAESVKLLGLVRKGVDAGNRLLLVDHHVRVAFETSGVSAKSTVKSLRDLADGLELWGGGS